MTSVLLATGAVTPLYDLNSGASTARVLGAPFPAQCLITSPQFIAAHPATVQRLVNALVRAMRFINTHTIVEIAAALPPDFFAGKDRTAELALLRATLPTFAKDDYSFSPAAVQLAVDTIVASPFDDSEEGRWRREAENSRVVPAELYTNEFVGPAMRAIK